VAKSGNAWQFMAMSGKVWQWVEKMGDKSANDCGYFDIYLIIYLTMNKLSLI
jgi:hypothetical protein